MCAETALARIREAMMDLILNLFTDLGWDEELKRTKGDQLHFILQRPFITIRYSPLVRIFCAMPKTSILFRLHLYSLLRNLIPSVQVI